ncbi:MAG TPA: tetratricopeptide repeat protein, partial [Verrucomicrobiota bacterium]|nr:tetratricopeptide repeat protein [Verrucomicrobiota bacterium]
NAETRAFEAAAKKFQLGQWELAAQDFSAFVTNFPDSPRVPEAIFYQAEAAITNGQLVEGISLLQTNLNRAGEWEDDYLFWIAHGHFQNTNYPAAAKVFSDLILRFPESPHSLDACIGEATAHARREDWARVVEVLANPRSPFQLRAGETNETVALGYLLLGEAHLAQTNHSEVLAAVEALRPRARIMPPELDWRRAYLECRLYMSEGKYREAVLNSTNLVSLAAVSGSGRLGAESRALQAEAFERLGFPDEAVSALKLIEPTNAPPETLRFALMKIAEIRLAQGRVQEAITNLLSFWNQYSNQPAADMALLALGELSLKQAVATNGVVHTNVLTQAAEYFETLLKTFPSSPLDGRARLGQGWCLWTQGRYAESADAFAAAEKRLDDVEDRAVALFKVGDSRLMLKDHAGALEAYRSLIDQRTKLPDSRRDLVELALYQSVRAALAQTNMAAAEDALRKILDWYPNGFAGDRSLLMVGEGYLEQRDPARARTRFEEFEQLFPSSALLPEVRLAIARTYEEQGDWENAVASYDTWMQVFTNHAELPRAHFARAWDTARAGREAEALTLFTNFVARWPTNELSAEAHFWIGNYHFSHGDFVRAEEAYQKVQISRELGFQAQMWAGLSAMARLDCRGAVSYFDKMLEAPACPRHLKVEAAFASGDAYVILASAHTNRQGQLTQAVQQFRRAAELNPAGPHVPRALIRIGECFRELGAFGEEHYAEALKAYESAITHSNATVSIRHQARIGLGLVAERKAEKKSGAEQTALLKEALGHYLDVFVFEGELRDGERPDLLWVKEAGLKAAAVAERLQQWQSVEKIYRELQRLLPSAAATWETRIANARAKQQQAGM